MKISEGVRKVKEVLNKFEELKKATDQDFAYWLKQMCDVNVYLTNKYCRYKKEEKVLLAKTPEIKQGDGWYSKMVVAPVRTAKRKKRRNQNEARNLAWRLFRIDEEYSR